MNDNKSEPTGRSFDSQLTVTVEFHVNSSKNSVIIQALQFLKDILMFQIPLNGKK